MRISWRSPVFGLGGLVFANIVVWVYAAVAFVDRPFLLGTALLAYGFGVRHAFDADHIAAIDNCVRKLVQEGRRPVMLGFFFAAGHSMVVVLASLGIAAAAGAAEDFEGWHEFGGVVGTVVSSAFLLLIGLANLLVLLGIIAAFRRVRRGEPVDAATLARLQAGGGVILRVLRPVLRSVTRSWHLLPVGFLFGLGFDTASEIGLLGISAAQAANGLSLGTLLVFPALFTVGMTLVDTLDSAMMVGAYGWAFVNPMRKLWYNLTMTAASVAIALLIGGIEAFALIGSRWKLDGAFWRVVDGLNADLGTSGFAVVLVFVLSWIVSFSVYRWRGYDELSLPTG